MTTTATRSKNRLLTKRRIVAIACLLLAFGVLITPIQWYVAYVFAGEKRRRQRTRRHAASI
jgi:hypothetical protein